MARIAWNDDDLLCAYQGENVVFTWDYSEFERHMNEYMTPSMYHFCASWVDTNLEKDEDYWEVSGAAVDAYFEVPINDRIEMHEQELVNLRAAKQTAEAKEMAAINFMLEDDVNMNPIHAELCEFVRSLARKYAARRQRLEREIHEEEQWLGGHEDGAEDMEE